MIDGGDQSRKRANSATKLQLAGVITKTITTKYTTHRLHKQRSEMPTKKAADNSVSFHVSLAAV